MSEPTWRAQPLPGTGAAAGDEAFRPWRRVRELGRGTMGSVWEVAHERTGERCALKVLLVGRDQVTADDLGRFQREAELVARLDHPNLARVVQWRMEPWPPWMVLELFSGGSLKERLERGPLPPEEARRIAEALATGLVQAHAQGILHRDLKPANVMFDAEGRPRVTDFGLARGALVSDQGLTRTGEILGTPVYMSPEQAQDAKRVDARSDVYGLGAVLYAMLTGQPPVQGAGNLIAALEAVITRAPVLPSKLAPGIPAALEDLCLRALAKNPADRFQSMEEMRQALAALAPRPDAPRARRGPALAAAALLAVGLLGAGVALLRARARPEAAPGAVSPPPEVAQDPPPTTTPGEGPAAALWRPFERSEHTYVHTQGWRQGDTQVWWSCVYRVIVLDGPVLELTLLRSRGLAVSPLTAPVMWDTSPAARQAGTPPRGLKALTGHALVLPLGPGAAPPQGQDAWTAALHEAAQDSGPWGEAFRTFAGRYQPASMRATWGAWGRLRAAEDAERPRAGQAALGEAPSPPRWAVREDPDGACEALCRVDVARPRGKTPVDALGEERHVLRGYVTALNACRRLHWAPEAEDLLLVPAPGLLPGVGDLSAAVAHSEALPRPVPQVRAAEGLGVVVHGWPWGPPLAVMPADGRYVQLGQDGGWTRLGWGGGVGYARTEELQRADGAIAWVSTRESALIVFVESVDVGRQEKDTLVPLIALEARWGRFWFDERQALVTRQFSENGETWTTFQELR